MSHPRQYVLLPVMLGGISGCIDAVAFLTLLEVFTTFQSGNSVLFGVALGQGQWMVAAKFAAPIAVFVIGVVAATVYLRLALQSSTQYRARTLLLVEMALIGTFIALSQFVFPASEIRSLSIGFFVLVFVIGLAAGCQTMVVSQVEDLKVRTTFVSGVLTTLAVGIVESITDGKPRRAIWIPASLWGFYVLGAAGGAWGLTVWGTWILVVPMGIAALLAVMMYRLPRTVFDIG